MDYLIELGNCIKDRRKALGISQQELAEAVGYAQKGMISRIEAGQVNISMDKLIAIAHYMGMKPSELLNVDKSIDEKVALYEEIKSLPTEDIKRIQAYIEVVRRTSKWHTQNGTESAGGSEYLTMDESDRSQAPRQADADVRK